MHRTTLMSARNEPRKVIQIDVLVDYSLSLRGMIDLCEFGWINTDIYSLDSSVLGTGTKSFPLYFTNFRSIVGTGFVKSYLKQKCQKPAPLEVGLAFAAQYRNAQYQNSFVLLDSITKVSGANTKAKPRVVCLTSIPGRRDLSLKPTDIMWAPDYVFLSVDM